jgi:hypothetical protein
VSFLAERWDVPWEAIKDLIENNTLKYITIPSVKAPGCEGKVSYGNVLVIHESIDIMESEFPVLRENAEKHFDRMEASKRRNKVKDGIRIQRILRRLKIISSLNNTSEENFLDMLEKSICVTRDLQPLSAPESQITISQLQITPLETALAEAKRQIASLEGQLAEKDARIASLEGQLAATRAEPEHAKAEPPTTVNAAKWERSVDAAFKVWASIIAGDKSDWIEKEFTGALSTLYKDYHTKVADLAWKALPSAFTNGVGRPTKNREPPNSLKL